MSLDVFKTDGLKKIMGGVVHYGRISGNVIEADVENPECEYHWHLKKQ